MTVRNSSRTNAQSGFSLIDAIIGIWGISIIAYAIMLVISQSSQMARSNEVSDQSIQIARSVMEDVKNKLLNAANAADASLTIVYRNDAESDKSSVCGTIYSCDSQNANWIISKIGGFGNYLAVTPSSTLKIAPASNPSMIYEVRLTGKIPSSSKVIQLSEQVPNYAITLESIARHFKIAVKPPGKSWDSPAVYELEAYFPIP